MSLDYGFMAKHIIAFGLKVENYELCFMNFCRL